MQNLVVVCAAGVSLDALLGSLENVHPEPPAPGDWCGASFSSYLCVVVDPAGVSLGVPSGLSPRVCALSLPPQGTGVWPVFCHPTVLRRAPRERLLEHLLGFPRERAP